MDFRVVAIAVAVGLDVLALTTAIGIKQLPWKGRLRLGAAFAFAELFMLFAGMLLGRGFGQLIGDVAAWLGIVALAAIGVITLRQGTTESDVSDRFNLETSGGLALACLSISLDSLGVGFALPILKVAPVPLFATVAFTTICFTLTGLAFGAVLGRVFEEYAQRGAGVALILIAIAFAVQKVVN